jgi:C4-dicarboxylate-specific signal transduction histidine kinase
MVALERDGYEAGRQAARILDGEMAADIPILADRTINAVFDARMLARWHVDFENLPPYSELRFIEESIWVLYRSELTTLIVAFVLMAFLITALVLNRSRLSRAQSKLLDEINERKTAENQLDQHRQKMQAYNRQLTLGEMTAGIAHEVNQPLNAIQNYLQAAQRRLEADPPQPEKIRNLIDKSEEQAARAGEIIVNIRNLFQADLTEYQSVSLNELIRNISGLIDAELKSAPVRMELDLASDLPVIKANAIQIEQLVLNLINNARQMILEYRNNGQGKITVKTGQTVSGEIQLEVADNGPGIPEDNLDSIFELFFTTSTGGIGLGLAICRSIIEAHEGRIEAVNCSSGGAVFRVILPAAET